MAKKLLTVFIVSFLFLSSAYTCLAQVFNNATSASPFLTQDDTQVQEVASEAKNIFQKITGEWKKINNKGTAWWTKYLEPYLGKYASQLKENIKQGWGEEKQEFRQDIFVALGSAWGKLKNIIFNR